MRIFCFTMKSYGIKSLITNGFSFDWNTCCFHGTTILRCKRERIEALHNQDEEWISNSNKLENMAISFFQDTILPLFCSIAFPSQMMKTSWGCNTRFLIRKLKGQSLIWVVSRPQMEMGCKPYFTKANRTVQGNTCVNQ